jgi:hypothetical protein
MQERDEMQRRRVPGDWKRAVRFDYLAITEDGRRWRVVVVVVPPLEQSEPQP